jgi:homogentisate 1,2-dioxygenase
MPSKRELSLPEVEGLASRQAHADIPDGLFEREVGREGFFGPVTHFYHRNAPTSFDSVTGSIMPRAFDPFPTASGASSPWSVAPLFVSATCSVRFWAVEQAMSGLVRNSDGDDLIFVQDGCGDLYCDFGHLAIETGDYILLPRGTMWRLDVSERCLIMLTESIGGAYTLPDWGGIGRHAPFDFGVFDRPVMDDLFKRQQGPGKWDLVVKRGGRFGTISYSYNPLDALGWKGDLFPVRLNVRDIRPLMSHRLHLPPSAHTTFVGNRFVICTFAPRPIETDAGAMRLPFYHDNVDFDELLLSHRGPIDSRGGAIPQGGITFHPMGFTHGPHPDVMGNMFDQNFKEMNSYLVMIDSLDPFEVNEVAASKSSEISNYQNSWGRSREMLAPDLNT